MRVLIVGCGYVGLPLGTELARQGHEVLGLRRNPAAENELRAAGISPLFADITRLDELKKLPGEYDWVVNCVAAGGDAENYRSVYLDGTNTLIEWLAPHPPQKFVYTSSTSVYAQNDGSSVDESSPAQPMAETSRILVETEKVLLRAASGQDARLPGRNFPAVILRVAGIYGPGRGQWFKQFIKGHAKMDGEGSRFLNMIHRDDLVGCILTALRNGRPGEIYNAADNEPVTQRDLFQWLAGALGKDLPPAAPENGLRRRGVTNKRVSNAKLRAELKYDFQFSDFRAGYTAEIARLGIQPGLSGPV
jgi:nucleoside-diphosphate-sugar epimerase